MYRASTLWITILALIVLLGIISVICAFVSGSYIFGIMGTIMTVLLASDLALSIKQRQRM